MGNRAVITDRSEKFGIYVHWNGGRDSVRAFLTYANLRGFRPPERDNYGWARLCTVISNFFGGDLSIGIGPLETLDCDNYDNGMYIIENWMIVGRRYFDGEEQNAYDLREMLIEIDARQPVSDQVGADFIDKWLNDNGEKICYNRRSSSRRRKF